MTAQSSNIILTNCQLENIISMDLIWIEISKLYISNTSFNGCQVENTLISLDYSQLEIEDCSFVGNVALYSLISMRSVLNQMVMNRTILLNNRIIQAVILNIVNSTISNSLFISNTGKYSGGIQVFGTMQSTFENCFFQFNQIRSIYHLSFFLIFN